MRLRLRLMFRIIRIVVLVLVLILMERVQVDSWWDPAFDGLMAFEAFERGMPFCSPSYTQVGPRAG